MGKETQKLVAACKKRWPTVRGISSRNSSSNSKRTAVKSEDALDTTHTSASTTVATASASTAASAPAAAASGTGTKRPRRAHHSGKHPRTRDAGAWLSDVPRQDIIDAVRDVVERGDAEFWRF